MPDGEVKMRILCRSCAVASTRIEKGVPARLKDFGAEREPPRFRIANLAEREKWIRVPTHAGKSETAARRIVRRGLGGGTPLSLHLCCEEDRKTIDHAGGMAHGGHSTFSPNFSFVIAESSTLLRCRNAETLSTRITVGSDFCSCFFASCFMLLTILTIEQIV